MNFKFLISVLFVFSISANADAQIKQFDKLEMWYSQTLYKKVYRKSNNLLDNPEFDYSMLPKYYKSLSLLQLAQNRYWLENHPDALNDAKQLFLEVKYSTHGTKIFNSHMYEITWLKTDMKTWASDLKRMGYVEEFKYAQQLITDLFSDLPDIDLPEEKDPEDKNPVKDVPLGDTRLQLINFAKQQLGVPYVWAGNSPEGFDCSGFTSFVMKNVGKELPRRSSDQYDESTKVKEKNVRAGDLVFFNNGSGISHVGIIISNPGESLTMIHSSSSKGIIITDIEKSEYWMKRLHGFGTYVK